MHFRKTVAHFTGQDHHSRAYLSLYLSAPLRPEFCAFTTSFNTRLIFFFQHNVAQDIPTTLSDCLGDKSGTVRLCSYQIPHLFCICLPKWHFLVNTTITGICPRHFHAGSFSHFICYPSKQNFCRVPQVCALVSLFPRLCHTLISNEIINGHDDHYHGPLYDNLRTSSWQT